MIFQKFRKLEKEIGYYFYRGLGEFNFYDEKQDIKVVTFLHLPK